MTLPVSSLLKRFGPQGWWPRLIRRGSTIVVRHHPEGQPGWVSRSADERAFEVALGAILTQNTAWRNVEQTLVCLAEHDLVTSEKLATARTDLLERCVYSSGYFRHKAKRLKRFARFVERSLDGHLGRILKDSDPRRLLLAQLGIGPETADTILLYGLDQPCFVVDTYTRRLLVETTKDQRWLTQSYAEVQGWCEQALPKDVKQWQEAHALIVRWGKKG